MIHYIKGNIFESEAEALVNTVNTVGVMGKGLALQFREIFPENYRIYRERCRNGQLDVGRMLITTENMPNGIRKTVVNFPTKKHWRYPSQYSYIEQGLSSLRREIEDRNIRSIAIPPLGAHNGGLEWAKVKVMIEDALSDMSCDIFIYEPSDAVVEKMKSERVKLKPTSALILAMFSDMNRLGEFASVFAAEKLVYFMQKFGAKDVFNIEFNPRFYGPYSGGKIAHLLYSINGSYIRGMGAMDARPFDYLWLTDDASAEAGAFIEQYNGGELKKIVDTTAEFLRPFYSNYTLELLSTIDYLLNHNPSLKNWRNESDEHVIETLTHEIGHWSDRKSRLFKPKWIAIALQHLRRW